MLEVIDLPAMQQLLRRDGLRETLRGLREYLRQDFVRWDEFDKQPRLATHYPWGVIELMPISDATLYAFKYVNGHPGNPARGRASVVALGVLAEVATGYPLLLSEMTLLTALRTAATSALAADLCARPEASRMALIGAGTQAAFQALAIAGVRPVTELRCFDPRPAAAGRLRANLARFDLPVRPCASVAEAVAGADLVTTATAARRHRRLLTPALIRPGMHINAIGGDCPGKTELDPRILDTARVLVEYAPQTRVEGELQLAPPDLPVTELWELVRGRRPGRREAAEVTVFDSVGFALEDFTALRYVRDRADALNLGRASELLPGPLSAGDLFASVVSGSDTVATAAGNRPTE